MLAAPTVGQSARRLAVIDWAMLETLLMLGVAPAAATELVEYRRSVVEPVPPAETVDLGLRGSPNMELLRMVQPDLIVSSNFYEWARPNFERIAPVFSRPVYLEGQSPYLLAIEATKALADEVGRRREADAAIDSAEAMLEETRSQLSALAGRPVFIINIGDARHFRAFGRDSMFGAVLDRIGFDNAWTQDTSYAAAAPVGMEALAMVPDALVAIISPIPPDARRTLSDSALWKALPMVAQDRVMVLDPIDHFGGLPAALRFARLFAKGLKDLGHA